jgi:hypothetical protein
MAYRSRAIHMTIIRRLRRNCLRICWMACRWTTPRGGPLGKTKVMSEYICIYIYIYIYIYVYICIYSCVCVCVSTYVGIICMYVCMSHTFVWQHHVKGSPGSLQMILQHVCVCRYYGYVSACRHQTCTTTPWESQI